MNLSTQDAWVIGVVLSVLIITVGCVIDTFIRGDHKE